MRIENETFGTLLQVDNVGTSFGRILDPRLQILGALGNLLGYVEFVGSNRRIINENNGGGVRIKARDLFGNEDPILQGSGSGDGNGTARMRARADGGIQIDEDPTITRGTAFPTAAEPAGSLYLRSNGTVYRRTAASTWVSL